MSFTYTKSGFDTIHGEILVSLTNSDFNLAETLVDEARLFVRNAFNAGFQNVGVHALKRLEDLTRPPEGKNHRQSSEYAETWETRQMKDFILRHLDCTPSQALACADAISPANAYSLAEGLIKRGLLEPTGAQGEDAGPRYTGRDTVKLIQHFIDHGYTDTASKLVQALVVADDVSNSDFFVDRELVNAMVSLVHVDPRAKDMISSIDSALVAINETEHKYGYGRRIPDFSGILKLADFGAILSAKKLMIEGDYASQPLDLADLARRIDTKFTLAELQEISKNSDMSSADRATCRRNIRAYWNQVELDPATVSLLNDEVNSMGKAEGEAALKSMGKLMPKKHRIKIDRLRELEIAVDLGL